MRSFFLIILSLLLLTSLAPAQDEIELCFQVIDNVVTVGYYAPVPIGGVSLEFSHSGYGIDSVALLPPALDMDLRYDDRDDTLKILIWSLEAHTIPAGTGDFLSLYLNGDGAWQLDTASASNARGTANLNVEQVPCSQLGPDTTFSIPRTFILYQNYPNPFNYYTTIPYELKDEGIVQIDILNIRGQIVRNLLHPTKSRGLLSISWNGRDNKGNPLPSGAYLCKMKVKNQTQTIKLLLLK
jgi:hypothetical protein